MHILGEKDVIFFLGVLLGGKEARNELGPELLRR